MSSNGTGAQTPFFSQMNDKHHSAQPVHHIDPPPESTSSTAPCSSPPHCPSAPAPEAPSPPHSCGPLKPNPAVMESGPKGPIPCFSFSLPLGDKPPYKFTRAETLAMHRDRATAVAETLQAARGAGISLGYPTDSRLEGWAAKIEACGKDASFFWNPNTGRHEIWNFVRCGVRICPVCAWRTSLRTACRYSPRIDAFIKAHPTCRLRFLTLSAPPVLLSDLKARCSQLHEAFGDFWKGLSRTFCGYVRMTDIAACARDPEPQKNLGDSPEAPMYVFPHIHALMIQRPKNGQTHVTPAQISDAWTSAMHSSEPLDTELKDAQSEFGAIKYAAKGITWRGALSDYNYVAALAVALDGIRCVSVGGVLRRHALA